MRLYVCGPMSNLPRFNIPAFDAAAASLRSQGYDVTNPADEDSPAVRAAGLASTTGDLADLAPTGQTWGDLLARDVKIVADRVDGIVLLPGWEKSRGARLEAFVAVQCRKPVYLYQQDGSLLPFSASRTMSVIHQFTLESLL